MDELNSQRKPDRRCLVIVMLLSSIAPMYAQSRFELNADTEYVLIVPPSYDRWALSGEAGGADWCFSSVERKSDVESLCFSKKPTYTKGTLATVELIGPSAVMVSLKDGRKGWIARDLISMTPEQRAAYDSQQAARAKRIADIRATEAKRSAEARAQEVIRQAKERAHIATLPKLRSSSSDVLVATSDDCAHDYKAIIVFGRKNGTGIEYRKKVLELISLGCAVNMASGTSLTVAKRNGDFVSFCAYDGTKKGTCGVALSEHVH